MAKKVLGKGLSALISDDILKEDKEVNQIIYLDIDKIVKNPHQPREQVNPEKMRELVNSIREKGVVQPILVRPIGTNRYQIIAGERRWCAVKEAGFNQVPAIIREVPEEEMLELSLIENLQREELNPIDEAKAYKQLIEQFTLTQQQLSQRIGKERSTIANTLRLLNLSPEVQSYVAAGKLSMGHARTLLAIEDKTKQLELCNKIINFNLSVRELEKIIKTLPTTSKPSRKQQTTTKDTQLIRLEEQLKHIFGTQVRIIKNKQRGKIEIEFYSDDELERILDILQVSYT